MAQERARRTVGGVTVDDATGAVQADQAPVVAKRAPASNDTRPATMYQRRAISSALMAADHELVNRYAAWSHANRLPVELSALTQDQAAATLTFLGVKSG